MPYFPILQKPTQNNLITKTSFRQDASSPSEKNRRRAVVETSSLGLHSLVAERRHSSITRYAKRSVACRDSPRHQTLRAGGTPLPRPSAVASPHRPPSIYMRFGDALLRRPRKRSRLQLTPDRVGGTRTDAYAPRSAAAERSIAKCRKLGRR